MHARATNDQLGVNGGHPCKFDFVHLGSAPGVSGSRVVQCHVELSQHHEGVVSDTVQRRHTVALFVSPKLNSCGVNMFLRPSYAPRGVNMAGAITSCSRLMISKFILTGSVSDDMTTAAYNRREREAILDKERHTIIVVYYTRGNVDGVMVGRDSDLPAGSSWSRAPYTNRLNMPCRHMCSSCYCACGWTPTPGSRRTGRCTASTSSCAGWHDGCLRRGECRRLGEARSRGTYRLYISRRMEQSRMR